MAKILVAAALAALLAGCASKPPEPQKFSVRGFTLLLPPKEEWTVMQQSPDRVLLGKPGDFTGETMSIQMVAVRLVPQGGDALVRNVRESERQVLDPKRFRVFTHDVQPYAVGPLACVMSSLLAEDRAPAGPTGPVMSLSMESLTLTCPDPGKPDQGVSAAYVHYSYPEDRGKNFADKAPAVLNTLTFGAPR